MEPKTIITLVLIAFIIGGIIFLQVKNKKNKPLGRMKYSAPFLFTEASYERP